MKINSLILLFLFCYFKAAHAQKPTDGRYTYLVAFAEWNDRPQNATCTVIICGNRISVWHNGDNRLSGKKGDLLDQGMLLFHSKYKKWIIAHLKRDQYARKIGGCAEGPSIIDLKRKIFYSC